MAPLGWLGIFRLGLVQTALGAIVVLTTSTLNRVMVVELALPAPSPACWSRCTMRRSSLRPRWGYGSDRGGRGTPWIVGGMAVLALGGSRRRGGDGLMAANLALRASRSPSLAFLLHRRSASAPPAPRCWRCWPRGSRRAGGPRPPRSSG